MVGWASLTFGLLVAFSLLVRAGPTVLERTVDAPDATRVLYGLDTLEANDETTFRWSPAAWGVALLGFTRVTPVGLTIEASASRPPDATPAVVHVAGSRPSDTSFAVVRPWRAYTLLVHPAIDGYGTQHIALRNSTFVPADASDQRSLGIAVRRVRVEQLAASEPIQPVPERALFLTASVLLIVLALRRAGLSLPWVLPAALAPVTVLGTLQLRAPATLAYVLPTAWFVVASGALVLLLPPFTAWLAERNRASRSRLRILAAGLTLGLAGTLALWLRQPAPVYLVFCIAGAVIALSVMVHARGDRWLPETSGARRRYTVGIVLGITAVALALRLFRINSLPIALFHDEVWHGETALAIWQNPTYRPVYVPRVDLPALLFYLMAPVVGTFGPDLWTIRIVPAVAGALTPLAMWFALRAMFGRRVALLGAGWMAVSAWGLYMSRWGFPTIFDPLLVLIAIGCVWRGLAPGVSRRQAIGWLLIGGLCTGLALYTYHTGRIAALIVLLFVLARVWQRRERSQLPGLAVGVVAWGLIVAPFMVYALANPLAVSNRINNVSLFTSPDPEPVPPLLRVQRNLEAYALMWHVQGDLNARHYAPGRPMLDPVSGVLFLVGIGVCVARRSAPGTAVVLWLVVGLLPGVFSDDAPHAMRAIEALPAACALIALGLDALLAMWPAGARRTRLGPVVALALALATWNIQLYFGTTADQRVMFHAFETTQTMLGRGARYIATTPSANGSPYPVYLWDKVGSTINIIPFLTGDAPIGRFDGTRLTPPAGARAMLLLPGDVGADLRAAALRALGPGATLLRAGPPSPDSGAPIYIVYGVGPEAQSLADRLPLP